MVANPNEEFENISYQLADAAITTSNFVDTLPNNTVPLSTALHHLNRQDSRNSNLDEDDGINPGSRGSPRVTPARRKKRTELGWTQHQFRSLGTYRKYIKKLSKHRTKSGPLPTSRSESSIGTLDTVL